MFTCLSCINGVGNLPGRKVRMQYHVGQSREVRSGVPQGSILSPTLYNIFVRDMPPPLHGCYRVTYADDVSLFVTTPWPSKAWMEQHTAQEVESLNNYEKQWKIQTNRTKFNVIHKHSSHQRILWWRDNSSHMMSRAQCWVYCLAWEAFINI